MTPQCVSPAHQAAIHIVVPRHVNSHLLALIRITPEVMSTLCVQLDAISLRVEQLGANSPALGIILLHFQLYNLPVLLVLLVLSLGASVKMPVRSVRRAQ